MQRNKITIYSLFAFLWAMSMVWHYLRAGNIHPVGIRDLFIVVPAILVMIRPHNTRFLATMALAHFVVFLSVQPSSSNHWMMQFFVNTTLFSSYGYLVLRRRTFDIEADDWLELFRPTVCLLVVLLYCFAAFHKLNSGYFSQHSYALTLYEDIALGVQMRSLSPLFPMDESFLAILPHLSLLTELLIPLLLFFKPSRVLGILLGFCFHLLLSFKEFPHGTDFPTLLGAAYVLFLPSPAIGLIEHSILQRIRTSRQYEWFKQVIIPAILLGLIFVPYVYSLNRRNEVSAFSFENMKSHHWAIYVLCYLGVVLLLLYRLRPVDYKQGVSILGGMRAWYTIPLLMILVAISPYLGLRTQSAFTMFSNLETEGNYTNHFIIPNDVQVFDYQKQVCVVETSADDIPTKALTGRLLPYYAFLRLTRRNPEASITYTFEGERFELDRIADKPALVAQPDWFERHYLVFKQTDWDQKTTYCDHRW